MGKNAATIPTYKSAIGTFEEAIAVLKQLGTNRRVLAKQKFPQQVTTAHITRMGDGLNACLTWLKKNEPVYTSMVNGTLMPVKTKAKAVKKKGAAAGASAAA